MGDMEYLRDMTAWIEEHQDKLHKAWKNLDEGPTFYDYCIDRYEFYLDHPDMEVWNEEV